MSAVPAFFRACKNACKFCGWHKEAHVDSKGKCSKKGVICPGYEAAPLKAIAGTEMYLCAGNPTQQDKDNKKLSHLVVLAKNKKGWKGLMHATSAANLPQHFYYKPRLNLESLAAFSGGQWVTFSGHPGSDLADVLFDDPKAAYRARTYEDAKAQTKDWPRLKKDVLALASKYRDLFGRDNFFLEIQLIDSKRLPAAQIIAKTLRWVSTELGIPCVATPDAHYPTRQEAKDQRVLLCSSLNTTLAAVSKKLGNHEDVALGGFFESENYHIPSYEEMLACGQTEGELTNTILIADMCEPYGLDNPPKLPKFNCPDGLNESQYVRKLCEIGWAEKLGGKTPEYQARFDREMAVLEKFNLLEYFLVVGDLISYAVRELKCPPLMGRGSVSGSLVAYLMDIHDSDPLVGGLVFERFINEGRLTPGKASLPDIDMDFPVQRRKLVIEYITKKYGADRVAHISTFQSLHGREALTQVLRAHDWGSFGERKEITAKLPQTAAISDKLQQMVEDEGEASVIKWALRENPEDFSEYCVLTDEDEFQGPLAGYFAQASRLEGCKRSRGKHASGIVVGAEPLADICPMIYDAKHEEVLAGLEYPDLEAMGIAKLDILGLLSIDKADACINYMETGELVFK